MFGLPLITISAAGESKFSQGSLLVLPPELSARSKIDWEVSNTTIGWRSDEFGYCSLARLSDSGTTFIVPKIWIDESKPRKTFIGYDQQFSRTQIERYLDELIIREIGYREHAENDFNLLVHDLRRLSTAIYHQATEAKDLIASRRNRQGKINSRVVSEIKDKLTGIIASQTMLKIRTDVLDFEGDPDAAIDSEEVPIYRRVDKVLQCFRPLATSHGIVIEKSGSSYGTSRGPNVFEVIPYVLIDNAIKYAPSGTAVQVRFKEDGDQIVIGFESIGPSISEEEREKIFERGYRGVSAREVTKSGSGIGLYLAKKLISHFHGNISVASIEMSDGRCTNCFDVVLPMTGRVRRVRSHPKRQQRLF